MTSHFYAKNYVGWPPVHVRDYADPNSRHWEHQAQFAQRKLSELLGDADYETWAELTWPGETIDGQSWKQIFDTCQFAIDHWGATTQELECTCNPAGGNACRVCAANSRIREREISR